MTRRLLWGSAGATLALLLGLSAAARPVPDDVPPDLQAGSKVFGLVLAIPTGDVLPGVLPTTEVKVVASRGKWLLLETPNQPRGPQWVNFDQVVSYRTKL